MLLGTDGLLTWLVGREKEEGGCYCDKRPLDGGKTDQKIQEGGIGVLFHQEEGRRGRVTEGSTFAIATGVQG